MLRHTEAALSSRMIWVKVVTPAVFYAETLAVGEFESGWIRLRLFNAFYGRGLGAGELRMERGRENCAWSGGGRIAHGAAKSISESFIFIGTI